MGELLTLNLMATPTEHIAIWILEASEVEALREPNLINRRLDSSVFFEVMTARNLESVDIDRGMRFLVDRRLINAVGKDGGVVTYPTTLGEEYLAAHRSNLVATQKRDVERRQDVRQRWYPIIIAILMLVIAYLAYRLSVTSHTATLP